MNKQMFLGALAQRIFLLPPPDIRRWLDYYSEMIDDRVEDGMTEEAAVADVGTVDEVAGQILLDAPMPQLVRAKMQPAQSLRGWEIALLILGSPIWVPLLLAALIVLAAVYIVLWSVVIALYAADVALAVSALGMLAAAGIQLALRQYMQAAFLLGGALLCAGLSILLFFLCDLAARGALLLGRAFWRLLKSLFIRKGEV